MAALLLASSALQSGLEQPVRLLATLHRALVRRAAHTLKSNGATLGAMEFAELCRTLEQQAKDGRLEEALGLVARIEEERASLERALEALRPKAAT